MMGKNEVTETGVAVVMEDNTEQIDDVTKETVEMEEEKTEETQAAEMKELVINSYVTVVYGHRWIIAMIWMMTTPSRLHAGENGSGPKRLGSCCARLVRKLWTSTTNVLPTQRSVNFLTIKCG